MPRKRHRCKWWRKNTSNSSFKNATLAALFFIFVACVAQGTWEDGTSKGSHQSVCEGCRPEPCRWWHGASRENWNFYLFLESTESGRQPGKCRISRCFSMQAVDKSRNWKLHRISCCSLCSFGKTGQNTSKTLMIRRQKKREHWRILKWFGLIEKILWVIQHSYLLSELNKCFAWYVFCQVPRSLVYCLCLLTYPIWLTNQPINWFENSKNFMQVDREARLEVLNKLEVENRALVVWIFLFKRPM